MTTSQPDGAPRYHDPALQTEAGIPRDPNDPRVRQWGAALTRNSLMADKSEYPEDRSLDRAINIWDNRIDMLNDRGAKPEPPTTPPSET